MNDGGRACPDPRWTRSSGIAGTALPLVVVAGKGGSAFPRGSPWGPPLGPPIISRVFVGPPSAGRRRRCLSVPLCRDRTLRGLCTARARVPLASRGGSGSRAVRPRRPAPKAKRSCIVPPRICRRVYGSEQLVRGIIFIPSCPSDRVQEMVDGFPDLAGMGLDVGRGLFGAPSFLLSPALAAFSCEPLYPGFMLGPPRTLQHSIISKRSFGAVFSGPKTVERCPQITQSAAQTARQTAPTPLVCYKDRGRTQGICIKVCLVLSPIGRGRPKVAVDPRYIYMYVYSSIYLYICIYVAQCMYI